jgi:hypothetical protein
MSIPADGDAVHLIVIVSAVWSAPAVVVPENTHDQPPAIRSSLVTALVLFSAEALVITIRSKVPLRTLRVQPCKDSSTGARNGFPRGSGDKNKDCR